MRAVIAGQVPEVRYQRAPGGYRNSVVMCGASPCEKTDCTHSEQHRAACEARTVMRWHRAARQDYDERVRKARGEKAARELAAAVSEQWKKTGAAVPR